MKLSEKLKEKSKSLYEQVADEVGVTPRFVGAIARGQRKALRGKGLEVRKRLEEIAFN